MHCSSILEGSPLHEHLPFNPTRHFTPTTPRCNQASLLLAEECIQWCRDQCSVSAVSTQPQYSTLYEGCHLIVMTQQSQICQLLLGMVVDLHLPDGMNPSCLICALHALLNFLYLAQYPIHSTLTLDLLMDALSHFHENQKNICWPWNLRPF